MGVWSVYNQHSTAFLAQLCAELNRRILMRRISVLARVLLAACSSDDPAAPPVYVSSCMPCHGGGLGGAPVTGDTEEWERRIGKGVGKVRENAINGLEGGTGVMPPKGGRPDLSDDEIIALVDYMVEASR